MAGKQQAAQRGDTVKLTLAHPLTLDGTDYGTEDEVTVPREQAVAIINNGYAAGVEPSDPAAVARALGNEELARNVEAQTTKSD